MTFPALEQVKRTIFMSHLDFTLLSDPEHTTVKLARKKSKKHLLIFVFLLLPKSNKHSRRLLDHLW